MPEKQDASNKLLLKLELLLEKQDAFAKEVNDLRKEITELKSPIEEEAKAESKKPETLLDFKSKAEESRAQAKPQVVNRPPKSITQSEFQTKNPKTKSDLERFIGENLISKIGIAITVFGVAIGAKYSIDHELISPLVRIILGYLLGLALLGVGLKLKITYENYSAVLVSGAMAIMYFMTYAGYSFYELFPQGFAFALMVLLTVVTTYFATTFEKQVIALFGLVGAYAVPFILSDGTGNATVLFSYVFIINIGILVLSFKKYWKPLYYSSFALTWFIYYAWQMNEYQSEHFGLALIFSLLFFVLFYLTGLTYKVLHKQAFENDDILLLGLNSFIFYGLGFMILGDHASGKELLSLFTLSNAVIHGVVSLAIHKQKLVDKNLFYFVFGLALVFITIAPPVQFDANWVTLFWVGEAALLFWIGRTKGVPMYEKMAYPLLFLAFFSLMQDWTEYYSPNKEISSIINIQFFSSLFFVAAFGFMNWLNLNKNYTSPLTDQKGVLRIIRLSLPAILLICIYFTFWVEINYYWSRLYVNELDYGRGGYQSWFQDPNRFKKIWLINYSMLFLSILSFANIKKIQNNNLGLLTLGLICLVIWAFLTDGLYTLSELRESYLSQGTGDFLHLGIRYVSFAFVALLLITCHHYIRQAFIEKKLTVAFDGLLYGSIIWILSSEFINWMDLANSTQSYKLGLSIIWGVYALVLIVIGIWKKKKHLRIGAISLFGMTLLKLFLYDVSHLDTISKTILFVSLGVLLLIISFLYNKYRHKIN